MPHLLFAAPAISGFHLHDRLAELAMRRGHRVTVLTLDAAHEAFWHAQGLTVRRLDRHTPGRIDGGIPLAELAESDCRLAGTPQPGALTLARARRRLHRAAGHGIGLLTQDPPDLIVFHDQRSGVHRLLHFLARRAGIATLHLGEGLLPGTLHWDTEGCDGDAALLRRSAHDYRGVQVDTALLEAATAALHAGPNATLALRAPASPSFTERLGATLGTLWGMPSGDGAALQAWLQLSSQNPTPRMVIPGFAPSGPFVALLLQRRRSPRRRLDGPIDLDDATLLRTAHAAVSALDPQLQLVVVAARDDSAATWADHGLGANLRVVDHTALRSVTALAQAVVTINHPHAGVALLHGTPVVHLGRALYGIPGVGQHTELGRLEEALRTALLRERPALRERFLSRMLQRDHVWCASNAPDRNGLHGVLQIIERTCGASAGAPALHYRAGPCWPLSPR